MPRTVLITGGAGFIGSNLAHELLVQKYRVKIIDNLSTGRIENLRDIRKKIQFIRGDVCHRNTLKSVMRGVDYVLHEAALPSVPRSINNPRDSHEANVNGTFNVLLAARDQGVKKVVLASSSSIYGNRKYYGVRKTISKREAMKPMPLSPYAVNKLIGEEYAKVFSHIFKVPTTCLRYFNVFGHNQNPRSEYAAVIPRFITAVLKGERPTIYGNGLQSRDFTYVDNVVQANILAMHAEGVQNGETINIACGGSTTLLHLLQLINKILGKKIRPKFEPFRTGDVKNSLADIHKAKQLLGYTPRVSVGEGLLRTVAWYKKNFESAQ